MRQVALGSFAADRIQLLRIERRRERDSQRRGFRLLLRRVAADIASPSTRGQTSAP